MYLNDIKMNRKLIALKKMTESDLMDIFVLDMMAFIKIFIRFQKLMVNPGNTDVR